MHVRVRFVTHAHPSALIDGPCISEETGFASIRLSVCLSFILYVAEREGNCFDPAGEGKKEMERYRRDSERTVMRCATQTSKFVLM